MTIQIRNLRRKKIVATSRLRKIAQIISADLGYQDAELSIVITDDVGIRELNRTWRKKDRATDVLSFPQLDADTPVAAGAIVLGDIVISIETAARQAQQAQHDLEAEVRRLLVHGVLHLLGHDHVHGGHQARRMQQQEQRLLQLLDRELPAQG